MHDGRPSPNRRLNPSRGKVRISGPARPIKSLDDGKGGGLGIIQSVVHDLLKDGAAGLHQPADLRLLREAKSQAYGRHGRCFRRH